MKILELFRHELRNIRALLYARIYSSPRTREEIVTSFHRLYYEAGRHMGTWTHTFWLKHPVRKCPLDLWHYQEIFAELRPDLIVECGTFKGGSALFMASMCDLIGNGSILSIDTEMQADRPSHPRIRYLTGSSTSADVVEEVHRAAANASCVVVILDSDHSKQHVLAELECYRDVVTVGSYLIVEDTNLNGHPVEQDFGPGPMEAVEEFLRNRTNFEIDASRERFLLTFNPKGYLKRVR